MSRVAVSFLRAQDVECFIVAVSSFLIANGSGAVEANTLLQNQTDRIFVAALLAVLVERASSCKKICYEQRPMTSSGLAIGSLTVPWVLHGLANHNDERCGRGGCVGGTMLHLSLCLSAAMLGYALFRSIKSRSLKVEKGGRPQASRCHLFSSHWSRDATVDMAVVVLLAIFWMFHAWSWTETSSNIFSLPFAISLIIALGSSMLAVLLTQLSLSRLVKCLTVGETMLLINGFFLSILTPMLFHVFGNIAVPEDDALVVTIFGMSTFLGFAIGTALRSGYTSVAVCITTCGLFLPAPRSVFYRLFVYVFSRIKHIYILIWWSFLMLATLPAMHALSKIGKVSNIIVRKGYHALAVALFLPPLCTEAKFLGVSLAVAWSVLVMLEVCRAGKVPILGPFIQLFMGGFIDFRDEGTLFVTHFALLLGLAAPVWLSNAGKGYLEGYDNTHAALSGILITGVGDAMASIVGSSFGNVKLFRGTKKTLEGTMAGAISVMVSWLLLQYIGIVSIANTDDQWRWWTRLSLATLISSLLEAVTSQLDNLIVPLHYFALLKTLVND